MSNLQAERGFLCWLELPASIPQRTVAPEADLFLQGDSPEFYAPYFLLLLPHLPFLPFLQSIGTKPRILLVEGRAVGSPTSFTSLQAHLTLLFSA